MFTDSALQFAREIMVVGGAIAVILVCVTLVSVIRILNRVNRMSQGVEEVVTNLLGVALQPLEWLQKRLSKHDDDLPS